MLSGFDLCVAVANATKKIQDSQVDNKQQQHSLVKGKTFTVRQNIHVCFTTGINICLNGNYREEIRRWHP